jgi:hypothetical protein
MGMHVFFVTLAEGVTQATCICGQCGGQFACESWRYPEMVPAPGALSLTMETLIDRTNPTLRERLEWAKRQEQFASDPRFEATRRSLDQLRAGRLRAGLKADLLRWDRLDERQRADLAQKADELARAMRFAGSIAPQIPSRGGCVTAVFVCLAVWTGFLWVPALAGDGLWWGAGVAVAGLLAGAAVHQLVLDRQVRRWTHAVLVPEGRKSGVDFDQFLAILDDLPPLGPRSQDTLGRLQEQAASIRKELPVPQGKRLGALR